MASDKHMENWQEPELTCPHIDRAIASGELSDEVKAELVAIREINSQLRYGTWALRVLAASAEREGMRRAVAVITEEAAKWPLGARVNMKAVAADIERRILSQAGEG